MFPVVSQFWWNFIGISRQFSENGKHRGDLQNLFPNVEKMSWKFRNQTCFSYFNSFFLFRLLDADAKRSCLLPVDLEILPFSNFLDPRERQGLGGRRLSACSFRSYDSSRGAPPRAGSFIEKVEKIISDWQYAIFSSYATLKSELRKYQAW